MIEREPLPRTPEEVAEDDEFFRWYGPWAPLDPEGLAAFMAGFDRPWWIVGGWSIEAFTGVPREHEDVDLTLLACDLPAFREHVGDGWHLWTSKRDPDHVAPLEDVTWVASDGLRYLRPEITLLYKAVLHRPKDDRDLAVTWPLLDASARDWLRNAVRRLYPGHAWLDGTMGS